MKLPDWLTRPTHMDNTSIIDIIIIALFVLVLAILAATIGYADYF